MKRAVDLSFLAEISSGPGNFFRWNAGYLLSSLIWQAEELRRARKGESEWLLSDG